MKKMLIESCVTCPNYIPNLDNTAKMCRTLGSVIDPKDNFLIKKDCPLDDSYATINEKSFKVVPDYLQQFIDNELVYLPVLYVNNKLTTIKGIVPVDSCVIALELAKKYAKQAFESLNK